MNFEDSMSKNPYSADFLLKKLMENMTDSIYFKDIHSRFVMVNKTLADAWGYSSPDELVGKSDFDGFREEDARQMFEDELSVIRSREPIEGIEEETEWKDGHVAWSSTSKMPLIDDDGHVVGTFGISRNITDHKLAELKIEQYAEKMRRIKEEMEEDLRMAAELQKTFFPRSYPVFPAGAAEADRAVDFLHCFEASGTVSGDICAIRRISDTECAILLCDVMGHGVRAALGTAMIYAALEELIPQQRDPDSLLEQLNSRLFPVLRSEDVFLYATACYAVFDVSTGLLKVANAGHPVPVLLDSEQGQARWLFDGDIMRGPALAVCEEVSYPLVEVKMNPGDSMILYTDGLYEVELPGGVEFGEDRLLGTFDGLCDLSLRELYPELLEKVRSQAVDGVFDDDFCMAGFTFRHLEGGEVVQGRHA